MAVPTVRRIEDRAEPRDEVYHRTRATLPDGRRVTATLVNLSPHGLMLRAEIEVPVGAAIEVALPLVGAAAAIVRWALGGRLGCELAAPIDPGAYRAVVAAAGG